MKTEEIFEVIKKSITDRNNASLNKYKSATALSNFEDCVFGHPFVDYKKVTEILTRNLSKVVATTFVTIHVTIYVPTTFLTKFVRKVVATYFM